jgi:hypothetical protein
LVSSKIPTTLLTDEWELVRMFLSIVVHYFL